MIKLSAFILLAVLLFNSCYYDKEEELYKYYTSAACDVTNVTFSKSIAPIFASYCNSCHNSQGNKSGNLATDSYNEVKTDINNIIIRINLSSGDSRFMPQGGGKLSDCDLKKIQAWRDAGTPDN